MAISYFQTYLLNTAEKYKAILKYKAKTSCMSKSSSKTSKNKNKQGVLFRQKFSENRFWGRNLENLSRNSEPAPLRDHMCQFSSKKDNFEFFTLNLGKLSN